ncbi:hypothetical protein NQ318_018786 [Aromia moschata]|uniref:Uncharacterized protein n=1 Tax=Aromia moschata TaxID=1265417 RepID=A0AAV8ZJ05_9CUCU|nr:hypothetical protein NQ318_018786 [Aromia moschata]
METKLSETTIETYLMLQITVLAILYCEAYAYVLRHIRPTLVIGYNRFINISRKRRPNCKC